LTGLAPLRRLDSGRLEVRWQKSLAVKHKGFATYVGRPNLKKINKHGEREEKGAECRRDRAMIIIDNYANQLILLRWQSAARY